MDNSMKLYNKAIRFYNEGYIDEALKYCEKSISSNIKNTSSINLKGLLYYLKGELQDAEALWKMNFQVNRDLVAKKYLEDIQNDYNKKIMFKAALIAIKELKLGEAVNLLIKCKESDFNNININNSLAICYIKLGEYNNAVKLIEEVFKIDKKNAEAIESRKELISIGVMKRSFKAKYFIMPIACILIIIIGLSIKNIRKPLEVKSEPVKTPAITTNQDTITNKAPNQVSAKVSENIFPSEGLIKAMGDNDYEKLYNIAKEWKGKELNINDKTLFQKGIEVLQSSGIEYFYGKGRQTLVSKDYKASEKYFDMAYDYGEEYYLYQDILYMLGYSYKNENQIDNCLKYYEEYDKKFPNGTYEETILYDISLIYKSIDINKSKNYASRLVKQYPKSIYNNSVIKGILGS